MRSIYTAPTVAAAEAEFVPFLEFPADLRKVVYTTDGNRIVEREGPKSGQTPGPLSQRHRQSATPNSVR